MSIGVAPEKQKQMLPTEVERASASTSTATGTSSAASWNSNASSDGGRGSAGVSSAVGTVAWVGSSTGKPAERVGQDAHFCVNLSNKRVALGVFDGHGPHGREAANFAKEQIAKCLLKLSRSEELNDQADEGRVLGDLFAAVDFSMRQRHWAGSSGVAATVAILDLETANMSCAHVGDCKLVVAHSPSQATFQTNNHLFAPGSDGERGAPVTERMEETRLGAAARWWRRESGFSLSHLLGDRIAQDHGAVNTPEVSTGISLPVGCSIILASDGLWRQIDVASACKMATSQRHGQALANNLASEAYPRWQEKGSYVDDITVIAVKV